VNTVKAAIIEGTKDPAAREALRGWPGRYFRVAAETCDDPDDRDSVMWRLIDLYGEYVEQVKRQNDARDAELAAARRKHLRIVDPEPTTREEPTVMSCPQEETP